MKKINVSFFMVFFLGLCNNVMGIDFVADQYKFIEKQTNNLLHITSDSTKIPRSLNINGSIKLVNIDDWTSGFFAGNLWNIYEFTGKPEWKNQAEKWTKALEPIQYFTNDHDIGFMMYCSYGNAYKLTKDKKYIAPLVNAAKSLSSRFVQNAGIIKSWNHKVSRKGTSWDCPVIIDNMMNLELLFIVSKITGDSRYRDIAISHANKTLANHVREDFSCFHVVNYDTISGKVLDKDTYQGFSKNSTWARGQAWAVYGFTMVYRETRKIEYLELAQKMADFYLNHSNLPKDMIPFWDFNVNQSGYVPDWNYNLQLQTSVPRDASAAAIMASALLELGTFSTKKTVYFNAAKHILRSLSTEKYRMNSQSANSFVVNHSVGNYPAGSEIDVPLIYADYYYTEALNRYSLIKTQNSIY